MVKPCTKIEKATTAKAAVVISAWRGILFGKPSAKAKAKAPRNPPQNIKWRHLVRPRAASDKPKTSAQGKALLEEDLRSPCTEEIAVFRAFARVVAEGDRGFVVIDTAPTGHTLLLLDAAESYHREVLRTSGAAPEEVRRLLPRLRDPAFTKILLVTLPEATPVHEAAALQRDLERADIHPFAWVIDQSLLPLAVTDPVLRRRRAGEGRFHAEVIVDRTWGSTYSLSLLSATLSAKRRRAVLWPQPLILGIWSIEMPRRASWRPRAS